MTIVLVEVFLQKKKKGRGPFRAKMYSEMNHRFRRGGGGGGLNPHSRLEDDDGDVSMSETQDTPKGRYTPYDRRRRRGEDWHDRGRGGTSNMPFVVRRDPGHPEKAGDNREPWKAWFKITIPYGKKYDKTWLLGAIQSVCTVPFTPIEFHHDHNRVHFYVQDASVAAALRQVSRRITDKEGYKLTILSNRSDVPKTIQKELKPEESVILKICMSKRYDGAQQTMDLKNIRSDPELLCHNIDLVLNRKNCMLTVLQIIEENIPELQSLNLSHNKLYRLDDLTELVRKAPNLKILNLSSNQLKSDRELDKMKGLKLEELWLDGNPLCDVFKDQSSYIRAVRERFPILLRLDGHTLPPPIAFDVEAPTTLPPCKGSYFASDDIKALVLRFLQQYYSVYDSEDRQGLLDAYHDGACCSLCIPTTPVNSPRNSLGEYVKDSRNLRKFKNAALRFRLLKHTRLNVVAFLNELPKTLHDTNSFIVDICAQTNMLLTFVVHGIFKEFDEKSRDEVRAFTRMFVAVPAGSAGLCIVNDQLFVRNATTEEIRKAFATPAPTPSSSPVPTLTATHQDLLQAFSLQSGMNLEWSQKCLQDNDWDFPRAAQIFTQLNAEGKIPEMAFMK